MFALCLQESQMDSWIRLIVITKIKSQLNNQTLYIDYYKQIVITKNRMFFRCEDPRQTQPSYRAFPCLGSWWDRQEPKPEQ